MYWCIGATSDSCYCFGEESDSDKLVVLSDSHYEWTGTPRKLKMIECVHINGSYLAWSLSKNTTNHCSISTNDIPPTSHTTGQVWHKNRTMWSNFVLHKHTRVKAMPQKASCCQKIKQFSIRKLIWWAIRWWRSLTDRLHTLLTKHFLFSYIDTERSQRLRVNYSSLMDGFYLCCVWYSVISVVKYFSVSVSFFTVFSVSVFANFSISVSVYCIFQFLFPFHLHH